MQDISTNLSTIQIEPLVENKPNITKTMKAALSALLNGIQPAVEVVKVIKNHAYWHQKALFAAGVFNATPGGGPGIFTFFDTQAATDVTNWPGSSGITDRRVFMAKGLAFYILPGTNGDLTNSSNTFATDASTANPALLANTTRWAYDRGEVNLRVNTVDYVLQQLGLFNFPPGAGYSGFSNAAGNATPAASALLVPGLPTRNSLYTFDTPIILAQGDVPTLTVRFPTPTFVTANQNLTIRASLVGDLVQEVGAS